MSRVRKPGTYMNTANHDSSVTGPSKMVQIHSENEDYHKANSLASWLFKKYDMQYKTFQGKSKARKDELRAEYVADTGNTLKNMHLAKNAWELEYDLGRFLKAQTRDYKIALDEIRSGQKQSHWIWYIFPQLKGLGMSEMSKYYGIFDLDEAKEYMDDPVLEKRLVEISEALLALESNDPTEVMGYPDDLKLQSCMTLFKAAAPEKSVFQDVLDKFFDGAEDENTLRLLGKESEEKTEI